MRNGENMLIDCGEGVPNFKGRHFNKAIIDYDVFFNFVEGHKREKYMKIVKEHENVGPGGINPGAFYLHEKFSVTFCCCSDDDAVVADWVANIPHSDKMRKIIFT